MKHTNFVRSKPEKLKNIPIWDQFYRVALDTVEPLPETYNGNKYILMAIDHYLKWCEVKVVINHDAKIDARFLEDEIICRFGVPKYIFIDNGSKWVAEFDQLCKNYRIVHQQTTPQWPKCNGMVKRINKTLKHWLLVLFATSEHTKDWDKHLPRILFGYQCGIHASTKFSPHMLLTRWTPRLRVDNFLNPLVQTFEDDVEPSILVV